MTTVAAPADLLDLVGAELGTTPWVGVDPAQVDLFATATAVASPPVPEGAGATAAGVVPPAMLLSLVNLFLPELLRVREFSAGLNVGLERVRFPDPAPLGARLRACGRVLAAEEAKGGVQVTVRVSVEAEGSGGPVCVADTVSRFLP